MTNISSRKIIIMCPSPRNIATMGLHNFVKIRGTLANPKHKQVKQYKVPFQENLRYFHNFLSILTWKYASLMSSDANQHPSEKRPRAWLRISILKWEYTIWLFKFLKLIIGLGEPSFLYLRKIGEITSPSSCSETWIAPLTNNSSISLSIISHSWLLKTMWLVGSWYERGSESKSIGQPLTYVKISESFVISCHSCSKFRSLPPVLSTFRDTLSFSWKEIEAKTFVFTLLSTFSLSCLPLWMIDVSSGFSFELGGNLSGVKKTHG